MITCRDRVLRNLAVVALLLACSAVQAEEPRPPACRAEREVTEGLPKSIKAQIGRAQEMAPCVVAALPEPVRQVLAAVARQPQLAMADPGQPWASGDLVRPGLPRRQLVRAAHSDGVWVVDYHKGGFASSYVVTVVGLDGQEGRLVWTGQCHRGESGKGKWRCTEAVK